MRGILSAFIAFCCWVPRVAFAQDPFGPPPGIPLSATLEHTKDFRETLVRITSVKIKPAVPIGLTGVPHTGLSVEDDFGTGFCLDSSCGFVVTNYHVAAAAHPQRIERQRVESQFLDTGPSDKNATPHIRGGAYAANHDLAIFELRHDVPHHHGIGYSLEELRFGQEVDIYGYPRGLVNPVRQLIRLHATYTGPTPFGLIAFQYQLSADKRPRLGGESGGIVVDRKTQKIVGVICESSATTILAVPVETLAEFVARIDPFLAKKVFPASREIATMSGDLYPAFVPARSEALEHRPEEPPDVRALREKAELLAESIRNYIAVGHFAWGSGASEPWREEKYELRVVGGVQRFREYPAGKKELSRVPLPHLSPGWINPTDEWSQYPTMVGTELRLKIRQASDAIVNGRQFKVFQFYGSGEDNVCSIQPHEGFGFFIIAHKVAVVPCYGEVWTDENMDLVRLSETLDLSAKAAAYHGWTHIYDVITYGWLQRPGDDARLVPQTFYIEARYGKKHVYWCRGDFSDYQLFNIKARLLVDDAAASAGQQTRSSPQQK